MRSTLYGFNTFSHHIMYLNYILKCYMVKIAVNYPKRFQIFERFIQSAFKNRRIFQKSALRLQLSSLETVCFWPICPSFRERCGEFDGAKSVD